MKVKSSRPRGTCQRVRVNGLDPASSRRITVLSKGATLRSYWRSSIRNRASSPDGVPPRKFPKGRHAAATRCRLYPEEKRAPGIAAWHRDRGPWGAPPQ